MKTESLNETVIRDVIDLIHDAKDTDALTSLRGQLSPGSISQRSQSLIATFPVIVPSNISLDCAMMINKAIERKASHLLSIIFAANSAGNFTSGSEYLKRFHVNLNIDDKITVDSVLNTYDKYIMQNESAAITTKLDYVQEANLNIRLNECMRRDEILEKSIEESSIGDFSINAKRNMVIKEDIAAPYTINREVPNGYAPKDWNSGYMKNTSFEKPNEIVETIMNVTVWTNGNKPGVPIVPIVFQVGVKAKLYPLPSSEIVDMLVSRNKNSRVLTQLLRTTSGELAFFKDFLFAIDSAKMDALSQSKKSSTSPMWKVLERRQLKYKIRKGLGTKDNVAPITTLVVSQEDINYIKKNNNIDFSDASTARHIMDVFGFWCFIIVDELTEQAKFIYDTGQDIFETVGFSGLEKENKDSGYGFRKMLNLVSKK